MRTPSRRRRRTAAGHPPRPTLSVVVPARDAAPYLGAALSSLTRQELDLDRLEVIVIDDGSTDGTSEVAAAAARELPGLRLERLEAPVGLSAARNHGTALSRGEHVAFLDADDWWWPGTLAAALATRERLDVDFVVIDQLLVNGWERTPRRAPEHRRETVLDPRGGIAPEDRTTMVNYPNACVRVAHRRVLDAGLLEFDPALRTAEDRPWAWRLHLRTRTFAVSSAGLYAYRRGVPGSLTSTEDERQLDVLPAYRSVFELLEADGRPGGPEHYRKAVRDLLVLLVHHLGPAGPLAGALRERLVTGARELLGELEPHTVAHQVAQLGAERSAVLHASEVLP